MVLKVIHGTIAIKPLFLRVYDKITLKKKWASMPQCRWACFTFQNQPKEGSMWIWMPLPWLF